MTINRLKIAKARIIKFKANVNNCKTTEGLTLDLSNLGLLNGHLRGLLNFLNDNELEKTKKLNLTGNARLSELPDCITKMCNISDIIVINTTIPGKTAWEFIRT